LLARKASIDEGTQARSAAVGAHGRGGYARIRAVSILVTGTLDLNPERRDDFLPLVVRLMAASRAEPKCEAYTFSADLEDPSRFHITEQWTDQSAFEDHNASPHLAEFMGSLSGIVAHASLIMWDGARPKPML
jgi:quinol monooxygenase YgiN